MPLKILSVNIRGLGSPNKSDLIVSELLRLHYDFFFLQETHVSCKQNADKFARLWPGKCFWSFGTGKSAGVALLVSPNFSGNISRFIFDSDGRVFSALIEFSGIKLNLVNIYAPNAPSDRKTFFERLHSYFFSQGDLIIGGDFNCCDSALDKLHSNDVSSADKNILSALKSDFSLVDVWRKRNSRGISFTWYNSNKTQASRTDRFLISKSLFTGVRTNEVLPCTFSDHDYVILHLTSTGISNRRCSVWKFNVSLLSDPDFMKTLSELINNEKLRIANYPSLGNWWDNLKVVIRKACIDFCARKQKLLNRERSFLTKQLIRARNNFHSGASTDVSEIKSLETSLASLITREAEGAKIRSRAQWIEEGEKPTRYFSG